MGYSHFKKIRQVTKQFGLTAKEVELFAEVTITPIEASSWLKETLQMAKYVPLINEKVKSERIVSPILVEIAKFYRDKLTLFSGEDLEVNALENLSGECDFFFTLVPRSPYLESPIISIVEAKSECRPDEDMEYGRGQCAAQLYGAKLFNEMEGKNIPVLYGCATDGIEWQFMCFENNVFNIDNKIYTDLKEILGVWHHIISLYIEPNN
jgi:hypothetical protein